MLLETWSTAVLAMGGLAFVAGMGGLILGRRRSPALKAVESELARTRSRLDDVVAMAGDWIWETDSKLRFSYFSERVRNTLGFAPEELCGLSMVDNLAAPGDPERNVVLDALQNRRIFDDLRYNVTDHEGRPHSLSVSGRPVHDADGRFLGYRGTATDITAEQRLHRTDQLLYAILESMNEGVSVVDSELNTLAFNRRFLKMLDFPADQFRPGDPFEKFIRYNAERGDYGPGDQEEQVRFRVETARKFEAHAFTRVRPDGMVLEIHGSPLPGGGFVTLYRDVTEQARAEIELRASERKFRDFAGLSADWFWETDAEQRFTYHSRVAALEIPGLLDAPLLGCTRAEVMADFGATPDPTPAVTSAMAEHAPFYNLEFSFEHPEEGTRWVRFSGMPVYDADERMTGYRGIGRDVTTDRLAERDLKQKEKRYRSIFRNAIEGMFRTDCEGRYIEVNAALARMHGCSDPEAFIQHFRVGQAIYVDPEIRHRIVQAVTRDGSVQSVEGWAYRADGSTFPFSESVWAVYAENGALIGYEGIVEDTSVREAARRELERSEQRYRTVSEMTSDMVYAYTVDEAGNATIEWVAGGLDDLSLRDFTEAGESCWSEVVHPDDHPILERRVNEILAGQNAVDDLRMQGADRSQRWIRLHGRAELDASTGRPIRILGAASDITARKRVEQRLQESAALLQHAIKIANLGHWQWDEVENRLTFCSPELAEMLGMTVEEYHGALGVPETITDYLHPNDRDRVLAELEAARRESRSYEVHYRFLRKDGTLRHGRELGEPVLDHHGRLIASTGTLQDVTEAKKTEVELRAAKEAAELANRTKSEFLANMSHELRTPLNAVIGFAEILDQEVFGAIGARNRSYARDIQESGEHLLTIINEILDVSKAEAGMIELTESEVDLLDVVGACLRLVQHKSEAGKVEIVTSLSNSLPLVFADERRLKQIVLNLLSNAVKFTTTGGHVTVSAKVETSGAILLTVADTGIGIAASDLQYVMEPFSQADSTLSRKHEGTGLGLPLTRGLVELHNGEFWLESEFNAGTTAYIRLPKHRVLNTSEPQVASVDWGRSGR